MRKEREELRSGKERHEDENRKNQKRKIAKICTCKHHTSTESNHEESYRFHIGITEGTKARQRTSRQSRVRHKEVSQRREGKRKALTENQETERPGRRLYILTEAIQIEK